MHNFFLNQFEKYAYLRLPNMFSHYNRRKEEFSKGRIMAEYALAPPLRIEELKSELDDTDMVKRFYHYRPTSALVINQKLSYYSAPESKILFKIDATSNINGFCTFISVTIYDSIEQMRHEVLADYESHSRMDGIFHGRSIKDVQLDFL